MKNETPTLQFNSVQLNIVTFVDVRKAVAGQSLEDCVFMMDNSPESTGQGTSRLKTVCKQGQLLNWIIYPMDMDKRPDGTWPPFARINNIVFLSEDGNDVASIRVCEDLKVYGGPDKIRTLTPVYYYWAGIVPLVLPPGIYKYRFILELENEVKNKEAVYLNLDTPSLDVISVEM